MSVRPAIVSAMICAARVAGADRPVQIEIAVEVDATAPVAADEIAAALRMRIGAVEAPIRVRVGTAVGGVIVSTGGATRVVALGGLAGADAARPIPLATVDLLDDRSAPIAPPGLVVVAARPVEHTSYVIAALGTAAMWSDMLAGVTADAELARGSWLGAVDVGAATLVTGRLHLREAVVRLSAGMRFGAVDVRAGATLVPIDVSDGGGDQTLLVGAGASARLRIPMSDAARFVVAGGIDAFATHTEYTIGTAMVATPWLAPWLAAGIEVSP